MSKSCKGLAMELVKCLSETDCVKGSPPSPLSRRLRPPRLPVPPPEAADPRTRRLDRSRAAAAALAAATVAGPAADSASFERQDASSASPAADAVQIGSSPTSTALASSPCPNLHGAATPSSATGRLNLQVRRHPGVRADVQLRPRPGLLLDLA